MTTSIDLHTYYFNKKYNDITPLCLDMKREGSDKSCGNHTYTTFYDYIFQSIRHGVKNVFELGLGTNNPNIPCNMEGSAIPCGSLRGWRDYFPSAHIYGADIDKDILVQEDRISTFFCNQLDPLSIREMWSKMGDDLQFDFILEDGLHTFQANKIFFENSIHMLKKGGYFIIEDVDKRNYHLYRDYIEEHKSKYAFMDIVEIPCTKNFLDNNLIVVIK